jgi:predicted CopG family antitoxin
LKNIALKLESMRVELVSRRQEKEESFSELIAQNKPKSRRKPNISVARVEEFQRLEEEIERLEKQAKAARMSRNRKPNVFRKLRELKAMNC